ncbi:MAG: hypothetical protein HZA72_00745, partial [Candidatus Omnitrophica bacterium]|nr:hypothetical protein [Candidatus Omnitrophota bacterium]
MIAKLDRVEMEFHDNAGLSYFRLANMENVSRGRIEQASLAALSNIDRQRDVAMTQILRKELTTVIYDYYVKYLGRLPSTKELNSFIESLARKSTLLQDTYTLDVPALKASLTNREERQRRVQEIADIIDGVTLKMQSYFSSPEDRQALIGYLNLQNESKVNLTQDDWNSSLNYLKTNQQNTMHFGQSAFLALKELVDEYYALHPNEVSGTGSINESSHERYIRLAINAILIDILVGVINPYTQNDLELSLFAMMKALNIEGMTDVAAYKLTWEDLVERTASYNAATNTSQVAKEKVIAHMNSNHYVVVTNIDGEGSVTYYEPNMGDKGESITVSKDEFMNVWKGYALSARAPPEASKRLTSIQAQRIKGSDIFLVISILASIISFALSFIDNEVAQLLSRIFAVLALVTGLLDIFAAPMFFQNLYNGIAAFKGAFVMSFVKIGEVISHTLSTFVTNTFSLAQNIATLNFAGVAAGLGIVGTGVNGAITGADVGVSIFRTVVAIPQTITISRGLDVIGIDGIANRVITTFISAGSFGGDKLFKFSLDSALQGLAIQGVRELGNVFHVDPNISNIVGISAGALVNAGLNGTWAPVADSTGHIIRYDLLTGVDAIGRVMSTTIHPNLAGELANMGVTNLGELLGVDNRISQLAGIGIRSAINPGIDPRTGAPRTMWQGITNGMLQGVASIGINYATQELGLNPLLANIGFSAISAAINAGLSSTIGPVNPETGQRPDVFQSFFNTYTRNALTFLGYNPTPNRDDFYQHDLAGNIIPDTFNQAAYDRAWGNYNWQKSAYIAQIQDFSQIVRDRGIVEALNIYGTSFFNATAVNAIASSGLTIGQFFKERLDRGEFTLKTLPDGRVAKEVAVVDDQNNTLSSALFDEDNDLIG